MSHRPTCPVCGGPIENGGGSRFSVTLEDYAESTAHVSQHNVCSDCWDDLIDAVRFGKREVVV